MHFYSTIIALTALTAGVRALPPRRVTPRNSIGNVMTGTGGIAPGGSVNDASTNCTDSSGLSLPLGCLLGAGSVANIGSNNAGAGGVGSSGSAAIQRVGSKKFRTSKFNGAKGVPAGNVSTGMGGLAPGGSVNGVPVGLINIGSNNAGNGGMGTSGDAL
ncbi:Shs13 protein [Suillus subluteus]|nr:Shs13 protein [Suillus subluteus]